MAIHKLANGPITMVIRSIESAEGNFGPQMVFKGNTDDVVFISEMSGAKGLARLNLTPETAIGQTVTLQQIKKDGKTFTNIDLGGTPGAAPVAAPAPRAAAPIGMTLEQATAIYTDCVKTAIATLGQQCIAAEIPIDGSAIQAAAATLFIRVTK